MNEATQNDTGTTAETSDESHGVPPNYLAIFGILCVLTIVSVVADAFKAPNIALIIAMVAFAIAMVKASYVMLYFMHLKSESGWKYIILVPTITLAIGFPLTMLPDFDPPYYTVDDTRAPITNSPANSAEKKQSSPLETPSPDSLKVQPQLEKPETKPRPKPPKAG